MGALRLGGRDQEQGSAAAGWSEAGKTLGVALDLDAGSLLVSVDGAGWAVAPLSGPCAPGAGAGATLFPALSGAVGARMRCNWGADAGRPMKLAPPPGEYQAVGLPAQQVPPQPPKPALVLLLFPIKRPALPSHAPLGDD